MPACHTTCWVRTCLYTTHTPTIDVRPIGIDHKEKLKIPFNHSQPIHVLLQHRYCIQHRDSQDSCEFQMNHTFSLRHSKFYSRWKLQYTSGRGRHDSEEEREAQCLTRITDFQPRNRNINWRTTRCIFKKLEKSPITESFDKFSTYQATEKILSFSS